MLCVRFVEYEGFRDIELFVLKNTTQWHLPYKMPDRFAERYKSEGDFHIIHSIPFEKSELFTSAFFKSGIWITQQDTRPLGGVDATVFGVPLHAEIHEAFDKICAHFRHLPRVFVGYHGTSMDAWQKIRSTTLLPSRGQLGTGIYVGSFWKACRFAIRDQHYALRTNPVVMRVLWTADSIMPFPSVVCTCSECILKTEEKAAVCCHEKTWTHLDAGFLKPYKFSDGKWATRNEEWVLSPSCLLKMSLAVGIDTSNIEKHYDPLQRNIVFF
jgi:hypothetical protein